MNTHRIISVIIPVLNAEMTIGACLDALFRQTVSQDTYEVIVVDDGSTDNTPNIISKYPGVRILRQEHINAGAARNLGVKHARGDIILFIDADCVPQEDWIEQMTKPMLENSSIVAVKGGYRTRQKNLISRLVQLEFEERYKKMCKTKYIDFVDSYSAAFRKEIFCQVGGFNARLNMSEDAQLSYSLSQKGYKMVFNKNAMTYHNHPSTILKYFRVKFWRAYWRMLVYEEFPRKALKDSYTPQTLKLQILLFYSILASSFVALFIPQALYILYASATLFLVTCIPIITLSLGKDLLAAIFLPFFLFLRAAAAGSGILFSFTTARTLQELAVFILLIYLLLISSFAAGGTWIFAKASILITIFPLVFFTLRSTSSISWRSSLKGNIFIPWTVFLAVMFMATVFSVSPYNSFEGLLYWVSYAFIFWVMVRWLYSYKRAIYFTYFTTFLGVLLSLVGIYFLIVSERFGYLRLASTFYSHNAFAGFLLLLLPISICYFLFEKRKKLIVLWGGASAIMIGSLILTYSRGGWIAFFFSMLLVAWIFGRRLPKRDMIFKVGALGFSAFLLVAGLYMVKSYQVGQVGNVEQENVAVKKSLPSPYAGESSQENALIARVSFAEGAIKIFSGHLLLGAGYDTYKTMYKQFLGDPRYYSVDPHNIYLKILAEMGVLGFFAFVWLIGAILYYIFKSLSSFNSDYRSHVLMLGVSAGLIGHLIHNIGELDWYFPANIILFWMMAGIIYKTYQLEHNPVFENND